MNQITIYREKPLTMEEFQRLESVAARIMSIKERPVYKSMPVADNNGDIYRYEHVLVSTGCEVFFRESPDERVMESLMRPATRQAIAVHLQRLCEHRPYARGADGWQTVVEDLIHDLSGCSEWGLIKTCERFRQERGATFFPQTADLIAEAKELDDRVRWAYAERSKPKPVKAIETEQAMKPSDEQKAKIAKILHDARLAHMPDFCEQCIAEEA